MQTKRTEPGAIPDSILISCLIKLSNIWGSVQNRPFYYALHSYISTVSSGLLSFTLPQERSNLLSWFLSYM